ncbi:hypothetical protein [Porphyromonas levii]|uniref:hypothetical protein n=1 Tax=Porphyromonas levii TaxID=28114 RepID=UPI001B8AA8F5|nr:hypothetical protein [Porphyromonas levii]MBR8759257.1 hypothetical protein [Porphyromonas levii]
MNNKNYGRFYSLLKQVYVGMDQEEAKELLCAQISKGRTISLRELSDCEFDEALTFMSSGAEGAKSDATILKSARSKALRQLQMYGVDTTKWERVNAFVSQPRIAGKLFYELSVAELEALTKKLRAMNRKKAEAPVEQRRFIRYNMARSNKKMIYN